MSVTPKDCLEFVHAMARHTQAVRQCEALMRYAGTLNRLDVDRCNVPWTDKLEHKRKRIEAKVLGLCKELDAIPIFSYEPMANAFVIKVTDGHTTDFDRTGIAVPS